MLGWQRPCQNDDGAEPCRQPAYLCKATTSNALAMISSANARGRCSLIGIDHLNGQHRRLGVPATIESSTTKPYLKNQDKSRKRADPIHPAL